MRECKGICSKVNNMSIKRGNTGQFIISNFTVKTCLYFNMCKNGDIGIFGDRERL